jgi:hypothetical protein
LKNIFLAIFLLLLGVSLLSCVSIENGLYTFLIDNRTGVNLLEDQGKVREFLENILSMPENFNFTAYERCVLSFQKKRTKLMVHSYYVITDTFRDNFHTLSFYGTRFAMNCGGVWALDTDSDMASYISYLFGQTNWDINKIDVDIDTVETAKLILQKMDSDARYYYRSHIKRKQGANNCNTALWETIVTR